jgi:hypothetical protein
MLTGAGSIGFDMKLTFAFALKIINPKTKTRLGVLNTLRNKCSHNWVSMFLSGGANAHPKRNRSFFPMMATTFTLSKHSKIASMNSEASMSSFISKPPNPLSYPGAGSFCPKA